MEFTHDPETGIQALANLYRITQAPAHCDQITELFMTHPALTRRVRAIGEMSQMPDERISEAIREHVCKEPFSNRSKRASASNPVVSLIADCNTNPAVSCSAMREHIQNALDVLIGEPLWSSGRASDLEWFQFGQRRSVKGVRGDTKEVGAYALHVQCAWRITHRDRVVVASSDLYVPPEESDEQPEDFNWDVRGANRRDTRISELFQNETRQFLVQQIRVGEAGSFTIILDSEYALDVFPDDSLSGEHWRIFKPSSEEPHFVVSGKGLEI